VSAHWTFASQDLPPASQSLRRSGDPAALAESGKLAPFEVEGELGRGGMGAVLEVRYRGRPYALKLLLDDSQRIRKRMAREARILGDLDHPGIVSLRGAGEIGGRVFLLHDLVPGARSLSAAWSGLDLDERVALVGQAVDAVGYAHSCGVLHRDLKPDNVLVDQAGRVRVIDFGLATTADDAGHLTHVVAGEQRVEIERGADGRRETVRYSSGVETRYAYSGSRLSEVSSWRGTSLLTRRAYRYDGRGRIAAVTGEAGTETTFTHDRRGRLLSAESEGRSVRYSYDAAGNRTAVEDGERADLEIGAGNRVLAHAGTTYTYGSHGALIGCEGEGGSWRYTVDVDGRLRAAQGPDGQRVSYGYAPDGTPLWREAQGERENYLVDRQQVVGEYQDGSLARSYVRGEALDDLLLTQADDETLAFHRDLVGSVVALSDAKGRVVARYAYGAFGEAQSAEGPAAAANRWRFAGRPLDAVTGLYDVRARHYDPELGRFTAPDPSGREGGLNLYAYAENDPTRLTDPLGLSPELGTRALETAAPKQGWFSRMLSAVDRAGQRLPGPQRFLFNVTKGVAQAAKDTVVGVGELFKKETWVALGEFVSELDDWETVKAVGKHLAEAGLDVGERYVDALLNDPDEFARMTGYGAGMIAGSVLGSKGIDKLAQVARAAKAARALRRAADAVDDVADARRRTKPLIPVAAGEGAASTTTASTATTAAGNTAGAAGTTAGKGAAAGQRGIADAIEDLTAAGTQKGAKGAAGARAAAKKLNDKLNDLYDDFFDNDLPEEELVANVQKAIADSDLPDAFKKELAGIDEETLLSSVVRGGGEDLLALANSPDPAIRDYALRLIQSRKSYELGDDKHYRAAIRDAERVHQLPAVQATEVTNGSGGLGRIFTGELDGQPAVFKFDRTVDYDTISEIERVAQGLEPYGGPKVLGRVRVQDSNGVWREAVAMEKVDGYDLMALKRMRDAGEDLPIEITPAHAKAIDDITQRLAAEGKILEETNLGDFMLTNDPDRPVVLLDMFVKEGQRASQGLLDHKGRPVRDTITGLMGGGN